MVEEVIFDLLVDPRDYLSKQVVVQKSNKKIHEIQSQKKKREQKELRSVPADEQIVDQILDQRNRRGPQGGQGNGQQSTGKNPEAVGKKIPFDAKLATHGFHP